MKSILVLLIVFLTTACTSNDTPNTTGGTGGETTGQGTGGETTSSANGESSGPGTTTGETTGTNTSSSTTGGSDSGGGSTAGATSGGSTVGGSTTGSPPPPPPTSNTYPVYPGCEAPATIFSNTYNVTGTFDPKKVLPGTRVHFPAGNYGNITLIASQLPQLVNNANWVWLDFSPGAKTGFIDIRGLSRILVTGAEVSGNVKNKYLISVGYKSSDIVVADNSLSSGASTTMTNAEWMNLSNAIDVGGSTCASVLRNKIRFVRHGIGTNTNITTYPANSCKNLIQENDIQHFSADGARMNCSDLVIKKNKFVDGWLDGSIDGNHDDMIQGFALNGIVFENVLVEENLFIDRYSSANTSPGDYQGICIFDGLYKNITIRKNVVSGGAYHGISLAGPDTAIIENNTVISSTGLKKYWVKTSASKTGVAPKNITVKNNLATLISPNPAWVVNVNNFDVLSPASEFVIFPATNGAVDFHLKQTSQFFNKGAGAL